MDAAEAFAGEHLNAGVPGHGVADALARAEHLLSDGAPRGVLVVVNQANDWEEALQPAAERYAVVGGWLLQEPAASWFWGTPLSRSHLLYFTGLLLAVEGPAALAGASADPPRWLVAPQEMAPTSAAMGAAIVDFAAAHPGLDVRAAFLPVDVAAARSRRGASPFGSRLGGARPWEETTLRDQLIAALGGLPTVDLLPILKDRPAAFQDRDYHLSVEGHAQVAAALREALTP